VAQYELKLVYHHLVEQCLSVKELSKQGQSFNYLNSLKEKTGHLKIYDNKYLGLNADQSW